MSIAGLLGRGKALLERVPKDALLLVAALLASLASFGFGYLEGRDEAVGQGGGISIEVTSGGGGEEFSATAAETATADFRDSREDATADATAGPPVAQSSSGGVQQGSGVYVASKNGTKYYLPTCSGAKRIKDENKVWFNTAAAAAAEGYTPAANCAGLK